MRGIKNKKITTKVLKENSVDDASEESLEIEKEPNDSEEKEMPIMKKALVMTERRPANRKEHRVLGRTQQLACNRDSPPHNR